MNRRGTIKAITAGAMAAVVAPVAAQAAGSPDAELVALCARAKAAYEAWNAHIAGCQTIEEEKEVMRTGQPLEDEADRLIAMVPEHRATSPEGMKAVAELTATYCCISAAAVEHGTMDRRLVAMLIRDARGLA